MPFDIKKITWKLLSNSRINNTSKSNLKKLEEKSKIYVIRNLFRDSGIVELGLIAKRVIKDPNKNMPIK
jgi:hypothetical protein